MDNFQASIGEGPSTDELKELFFKREITYFQTSQFGVVALTLNSIEFESGSGQTWILTGIVQGVDRGNLQHGDYVKLYYHSARRQGQMTPLRMPVPA